VQAAIKNLEQFPSAGVVTVIGFHERANAMNMRWISCSAAAVTVAAFMSAGGAQAAMSPVVHYGDPSVQRVDCAAGFHIGPLGACIIGTEEEPHDKVIERRATDEGCETKSVQRSDAMGNSETRTKSNCD
jgi:hypothetical protein